MRRQALHLKALIFFAFVAVILVSVSACGLGPGQKSRDVQLSVTRDFGSRSLENFQAPKQAGEETVMRLLTRNTKVQTRYGGKFVHSINGLGAGRHAGRSFDWLYYVNGIEAAKGAADRKVHAGDRIWWDYHDWGAAQRIPAVVGSFPEPFRSGTDGKRLPVRIECLTPRDEHCKAVKDRLTKLGVPTAQGTVASGLHEATIRVLIGPWVKLKKEDDLAASLAQGPASNGIYVRFVAGGKGMQLLTPEAKPAATVGLGSGLVAATMREEQAPVWFITGTDEQGVGRAVAALDERTLRHSFALALTPQETRLPLIKNHAAPH